MHAATLPCALCPDPILVGQMLTVLDGQSVHQACVTGRTRPCREVHGVAGCEERLTFSEHGNWIHPPPNGTVLCRRPDEVGGYQIDVIFDETNPEEPDRPGADEL